MLRNLLVLFTLLAFTSAPLASHAAPPRDTRVVPMTTGERLTEGAIGIGLVGVGGGAAYFAGTAAVAGGVLVGLTAPVIGVGLVAAAGVGLVAWGGYKILEAIRGRKEVDAGVRLPGTVPTDGGETTRPGAGVPDVGGEIPGGPGTGGGSTPNGGVIRDVGGAGRADDEGINIGRHADTRPGSGTPGPSRRPGRGAGAPR